MNLIGFRVYYISKLLHEICLGSAQLKDYFHWTHLETETNNELLVHSFVRSLASNLMLNNHYSSINKGNIQMELMTNCTKYDLKKNDRFLL